MKDEGKACDILCKKEKQYDSSCPMNGLDNLGDVRCKCCDSCRMGCKKNRDQLLKKD